MKLINLYEADIMEPEDDFEWHKNPSQEQINQVAKENNKVHFLAMEKKTMLVFPYDVSFKDFVRLLNLFPGFDDSLMGTAQKTGMGWMVAKIINIDAYENLDAWDWVDKYFNITPYKRHSKMHSNKEFTPSREKPDKEEIHKNLMLSLDRQHPKETSLKKTSLKDFIEKNKAGHN